MLNPNSIAERPPIISTNTFRREFSYFEEVDVFEYATSNKKEMMRRIDKFFELNKLNMER